jgi:putative ABC transport system permease protein
MFFYYLDLARRHLRRNLAISLLMVLAIAFGIGASMTSLTVLRALSADPLPGKSPQLYYVQLDPRPADGLQRDDEPPLQLTRTDAEALVRAARADRQAMIVGGSAAIDPQRPGLSPFYAHDRQTSADFFPMFQVPFLFGRGWTAAEDASAARVVVVARALAEKVFGQLDVVGRTLRVEGAELRVVGVLDTWEPNPHFYDLTTGSYGAHELLFVPFSTARELKLSRSGTMNCWKASPEPEALGASCEWIQLWVELKDPARAANYRDFLTRYSEEQRAAGRFERPANPRLRDLRAWLAFREVVPNDARLQTWIALGFLVVCLVNTVGLLLTTFLRRAAEIGVRRALGASKRAIFAQLLTEAATLGLAGGLLGIGLAWLGLWLVRHQPAEYAALATLDLPMLLATFALAMLSSVLAGVLPAWRGCQVTPALQLKSH